MKRILFGVLLALFAFAALAHEVRPAYLQLRQIGPETYDVLWKVPAQGDDLRLALDVEFPDDTVNDTAPFASFINRAFVQRWQIRRKSGLSGTTVRIDGLGATATDVLVHVERLDGAVQTTRLTPAAPSFVVEGTSSAWAIAASFVQLGIEHILTGYDHLLFVLALILIVRDRRRLILTVTSFTVAHSITLGLGTLGVVHVPAKPVEATIALSILLLATEILRIHQGQFSRTARWPWAVAFTFGLLHGFGFANALAETGLPQADIPLALLTFNVGVEVGQLGFIGAVLAALHASRFLALPAIVVRQARLVSTYAIGILAASWCIGRVAAFWT